MKMNQIYEFTNSIVKETLGETAVLQEDLSNVVDIGNAIFDNNAFDAYVKTLINHIGKVIFVNRPYSGAVPSVLMDSWEYGSVLEKISSEMPVAVENESWNLVDGQSYDPHIFYEPKAEAKFFNKRTTFEIDRSVTALQVKQSFSGPEQLNAFISMLENETRKAMTVRNDELIMRTINNMIVETINDAFPGGVGLGAGTTPKAVNLLYRYNQQFGESLTAAKAPFTPEFIRYASAQLALTSTRLTRMSKLFNVGKRERFTPKEYQHIVLLGEFTQFAGAYLQSDTFHDEFTELPNAEVVPYWQGSGTDYEFGSTGKIVAIPASQEGSESKTPITVPGVLGVIFDRDALGVTNFDPRVTTQWNAKAEFTNYFYKQDAGYFNDLNENFVVFYVADNTTAVNQLNTPASKK